MLLQRTFCLIQRSLTGLCVAVAMGSLITSVACGQQNDWKEQANQRIRSLRQRDTQIRVLDEQGQPLSGVAVEVKQTSKAFPFGAALSPTVLSDPRYQEFFLAHFNWAVFENDMKWYSNEGRRGREDYSRADAMLAWCNEHDIPVRGHCIFWEPEKWQPRWLRGLSGEELRAAVEQRIDSIAAHYRGKVVHWDVNNEMLHGKFFKDRLGEDIHAWMFKRAHEIDPKARLFANEFNILSVDKDFKETQVDQYVAQIRQLIDDGAPIQGVGIQGHIWSKTVLDHPEVLQTNLDKVAKLGLPIWISEFDAAFDEERANAECLEAVYRTAYSHPAVEGIMAWVFWAGNSWRGPNAGLARRDWSLNAAGQRFEALMDEWSTTASGVTDADGIFAFRGFHGNYMVTLRNGSQQLTRKEFRLAPGKETLVVPVVGRIPLVYDVEHTGASFAKPVLPTFESLPIVRPLPDPFEWSDGSGRSTKFSDWSRRRAEIKAEIEHYGIGEKPARPEDVTASYSDGILTVNVTVKGETLKLTSRISLPEGDGPFPAVIGIGSGTGSLPSDIFASRDMARIPFNFGQVMAHTQTRGKEPINRLYPDLTYIGAYSAWSWGVSRLIDGLELVQDDLPIDLKHLAVTGCSFAGKMALFAGAFDERIALTIAQESGGGGAAAWRVSETLGNVETLGNTSNKWFIEDMFRFANKVPKLPYDHHELMAMVAPRALLVLGNPDYEWLADESGYVSCRAAHEVWKAFGLADRFGFSIVGGHGHCRLPDSQRPEVEAFVDKFLLGDADADTSVTKHPFAKVKYEHWYDGWLTGKSTFPEPDATNVESVFYEVECATHGSDWIVVEDAKASNGQYLTIKSGLDSPNAAPTSSTGSVQIPFTVSRNSKYYLFARVNCPSANDDSFWVKIDDGEFEAANGLRTTGWDWVQLTNTELKAGEHTLTLTYREDGALIDKIGITTYVYGPTELGAEAINLPNK